MSSKQPWAAPAIAATALLVAACGGGAGAGPVTAPGTPAAVQTAPPTPTPDARVAGVPVAPSPAPGAIRIEAEGLTTRSATPTLVGPQTNCCGVRWSAGSQLWFRARTAGQTVDLAFGVARAGTYRVDAGVTMAPDYGIVTLSLDGQPLVSGFDGYQHGTASGTVDVAPVVLTGGMPLTAGTHTLTIAVTGRNPASSGAFAGVDYLDLTPD